MRAALYLRVSTTLGQTVENRRLDLLRYVEARGWTLFREYADEGVSGAKERTAAARCVACGRTPTKVRCCGGWRLDRVGRNLRHLIVLLDDLQSIGVGFVSLNEGIDLSIPAGTATASHSRGAGGIRTEPDPGTHQGGPSARPGTGEAPGASSVASSENSGRWCGGFVESGSG